MASNYPAGAEHDPNAPYNQVDCPPRPHEVELSLTFKVNAKSIEYAEDDVKELQDKIFELLEKGVKGIDIEDVDIEVTRLEADYDEDYNIYGDYFDDYDSHGDYYFHDED